jgi:hypothetical protein
MTGRTDAFGVGFTHLVVNLLGEDFYGPEIEFSDNN